MRDIPLYEIEAGAQALRKRQITGHNTRSWDALSESEKQEWRARAAVVLAAADAAKKPS
jgi:hypothetical protein